MMEEKRPLHKSYYFILTQKIGLDRKLLYNKIIECFLEHKSSEVNYYIWDKQIHRHFESDFSFKRDTPGNKFIFPPKLFSLDRIISQLDRAIQKIGQKENSNEILLFLTRNQIDRINISTNDFNIYFRLLRGITNQDYQSKLQLECIHTIAKKIKEKIFQNVFTDKEKSDILYYFEQIKQNLTGQTYEYWVDQLNNQLKDDYIAFKLWTQTRHFVPKAEVLTKHFLNLDLQDYICAPPSFHIKTIKEKVHYFELIGDPNIFLGLISMSIIETPIKIVQFLPIKKLMHKLVLFYSFNRTFSSMGSCFETVYEFKDYDISHDDIMNINGQNIDVLEFIKLLNFTKLLQYEYSARTYKFASTPPVGFLHLKEEERKNIVKGCLNRNQNDKCDEYLTKIILTIKSSETLTLGKKIIDLMLLSHLVNKESVLNEISLNGNESYIERLNAYYK